MSERKDSQKNDNFDPHASSILDRVIPDGGNWFCIFLAPGGYCNHSSPINIYSGLSEEEGFSLEEDVDEETKAKRRRDFEELYLPISSDEISSGYSTPEEEEEPLDTKMKPRESDKPSCSGYVVSTDETHNLRLESGECSYGTNQLQSVIAYEDFIRNNQEDCELLEGSKKRQHSFNSLEIMQKRQKCKLDENEVCEEKLIGQDKNFLSDKAEDENAIVSNYHNALPSCSTSEMSNQVERQFDDETLNLTQDVNKMLDSDRDKVCEEKSIGQDKNFLSDKAEVENAIEDLSVKSPSSFK